MILYTSEYSSDSKTENRLRRVLVYGGVTAFCALIFLVYDRFSHDVRSPYMTFLFAWPLVLGLFPALVLWLRSGMAEPSLLTGDLYRAGVAAVTLSSLLRGIFEIAGTSSDYQMWLMAGGLILLAAGVILYAADVIKRKERRNCVS